MSYFLVSNDDGILAPGINALAEVVEQLGPYKVVAPTENVSGASNKLTLNRPLIAKTLENGFIAVDGTPSDCVHLAINGMLDDEPSMVVSGINAGANLGDDVLYSGTVAAAIEGRFLMKPGLAVSLVNSESSYLETAKAVTLRLLKAWEGFNLPQHTILNVNVPDLPLESLKGYKITRLGRRRRSAKVHPIESPRGQLGYWIGIAGVGEDAGEGTDFHAIERGFVSITPLTVDMTRHEVMSDLAEWADCMALSHPE